MDSRIIRVFSTCWSTENSSDVFLLIDVRDKDLYFSPFSTPLPFENLLEINNKLLICGLN